MLQKTYSIFYMTRLRKLSRVYIIYIFLKEFLDGKKATAYCCEATVGSEQQHNQDLREMYKVERILEFITFNHNALHLTTRFTIMHCATNQLKYSVVESVHRSFAAQTQSFFVANFLPHG